MNFIISILFFQQVMGKIQWNFESYPFWLGKSSFISFDMLGSMMIPSEKTILIIITEI